MNLWEVMHLGIFMVVLGCVSYLFLRIVYRRYLYVSLGKSASVNGDVREKLFVFMTHVFGQRKLLKDPKSGLMHLIMFYGFLIIQLGAIDLFIKGLFPGKHLFIPAYPLFLFIQEITTLLVLFATFYAFYRRYIEKIVRLKRGWQASWVIIFLTLLMSSILLTAAFEKIWFESNLTWYTPISSIIAYPFIDTMSATAGFIWFYLFWWLHAIVLFSFLLYIPQSKHFHLLIAPLNVWIKGNRKYSELEWIDFTDDTATEFGRGKIEDFRQDQLIDLYACVECGRCTDVCPASGTGKLLSPMDLITKMRDHLTEKGAVLTSTSPWIPKVAFASENQQLADAALIEGVISSQELWACTTCRNCEEACPVMNEHVDKIIDMRRYLVMTEGQISSEVSRVFGNIERQGNPWGISKKDRSKWVESADVPIPTVQQTKEFEYLLYVGSMGSYDHRSQKITQALVKVLHHAGVKFAILGNEEKNSGDTARRLGNEFLFQQLAEETASLFQQHQVKKIITIDPHAFHAFKNEYHQLGAHLEVYHHTQILAELLKKKQIRPIKPIHEKVTYHDSCYLGRYNGEFDAPRYILKQIPGIELTEMERNRDHAMCCGAGGGLMWMEETEGKRVNVARIEQALKVKPSLISSACPYCLVMLSDGTKSKERDSEIKTMDIVEVLAASLG